MLRDIDLEWTQGYIQSASGKLLVSGQYLCPPVQVAPGSQTTYDNATDTIAAVASGVAWTGYYIVPPSGSVIVTASFAMKGSVVADVYAFGLSPTGSVSSVLGYLASVQGLVANDVRTMTIPFVLTGLTPGQSIAQDLVFAANAGEVYIVAYGQNTLTPNGSAGAPIVMTVQAI